jgi:hypothetical protein
VSLDRQLHLKGDGQLVLACLGPEDEVRTVKE